MNCKSCLEMFTNLRDKPFYILPCDHIFCKSCLIFSNDELVNNTFEPNKLNENTNDRRSKQSLKLLEEFILKIINRM